jgi:hypothetical protein
MCYISYTHQPKQNNEQWNSVYAEYKGARTQYIMRPFCDFQGFQIRFVKIWKLFWLICRNFPIYEGFNQFQHFNSQNIENDTLFETNLIFLNH